MVTHWKKAVVEKYNFLLKFFNKKEIIILIILFIYLKVQGVKLKQYNSIKIK